ncbi:MAG: methyltransferase domain-containing protein [Nanoarchaeota archaeon]
MNYYTKLYKVAMLRNPDIAVREYYVKNKLLSWIFFNRIEYVQDIVNQCIMQKDSCLDIGGGKGILTLFSYNCFNKITCIDLDNKMAKIIMENHKLKNVKLVTLNFFNWESKDKFHFVFALDVLEHFENIDLVVSNLSRITKISSNLVISLPTEDLIYRLCRFTIKNQLDIDEHKHDAVWISEPCHHLYFHYSNLGCLKNILIE